MGLDGTNEEPQLNIEEQIEIRLQGILKKISDAPSNLSILDGIISEIYQQLLDEEKKLKEIARALEIDYNRAISCTSIGQNVSKIRNNIKYIQSKVAETNITSQISGQELDEISSTIIPLLDGISFGIEVSKELRNIIEQYKKEERSNIKKELYTKVQETIQRAKVHKYSEEVEKIQKKKVGFLGRIIGKDILRDEKLKNAILKRDLAQKEVPQVKTSVPISEMIADMYATSIIELDSKFTPEMANVRNNIISNFKDTNNGEFTEEYMKQRVQNKLKSRERNLPMVPMPATGLFSKIKEQIQELQLENSELEIRIERNDGRLQNRLNYCLVEEDAIKKFEQITKSIVVSTTDRNLEDRLQKEYQEVKN